jgi:hypothetical protein
MGVLAATVLGAWLLAAEVAVVHPQLGGGFPSLLQYSDYMTDGSNTGHSNYIYKLQLGIEFKNCM